MTARRPPETPPHPGSSIAFDRIASDYDRTRSLPPRTMTRVLEVLRSELQPRQPCLEIGVGTGRLAIPLNEAGIRIAGIDLSEAMLERLVEKSHGRTRLGVARADAARLPFADGAFGSGLAMHVLHVISPWQDALAELVRVVRPGGTIVTDAAVPVTVRWADQIQQRFLSEAGISRGWPGARSREEVDQVMGSLGARPRDLPPILVYRRGTIGEYIDRLEAGVYSFTWHVDEATRVRAARRLRRWARSRLGPLDQPKETRRHLIWRAYDLAG